MPRAWENGPNNSVRRSCTKRQNRARTPSPEQQQHHQMILLLLRRHFSLPLDRRRARPFCLCLVRTTFRTISTPFLDVFSIPNLVCKISYESLLFAETNTIIEKATTTATRNCVVVSFILIIVIIVIKSRYEKSKELYFLYLFFPRCFSLSLSLEKPRSPQRDAEEVHGRRDYREE